MSSVARAAQEHLDLPRVAKSHEGYEFSPSSDRWQLSKDVTLVLSFLRHVSAEANLGFRLALARYAQEYSAKHTQNMRFRFSCFIRDTKTPAVTAVALTNWRSQLDAAHEWRLGGLKGFLFSWHGWGFPGVSDEVASLLQGWRIKGNEKGRAVAQGDPNKGPYTDLEINSILDWAGRAVSLREIELEACCYLLTLIMAARRPVQIAALRGIDLPSHGVDTGAGEYVIQFPRAKQRGARFRQHFRQFSANEDLHLVLRAQHQVSVARVKDAIGCDVPEDLEQQVPIFINSAVLDGIRDSAALREILMGDAPDRLHATTAHLAHCLDLCETACTAKSERTGKRIHLFATRFRYTRGTNLRREGYGAPVIAELLDHSDTQNVSVYIENTVQEAEIINRIVGPKLAPFAQACMGTLVDSERDAIRGDDPRSRVPNHNQEAVGTCGNYGFCASGFKACYTCHHFQPWVDGPHKDVLKKLYAEKERLAEAGCAREVVNATDRLILAVEHCVSLCEEAKGAKREAVEPTEGPREAAIRG